MLRRITVAAAVLGALTAAGCASGGETPDQPERAASGAVTTVSAPATNRPTRAERRLRAIVREEFPPDGPFPGVRGVTVNGDRAVIETEWASDDDARDAASSACLVIMGAAEMPARVVARNGDTLASCPE